MRVGYIRVSTKEQNTIRQEIIMKDLNVEKVYIDKCSGKDTNRPALKQMMSFVREGDTVVVESISRFARNTRDLLALVDELTQKGVQFESQKEKIDTSTPMGECILTIFGAIAELERKSILERQREGIEAKKERGEYRGREPIKVDESSFKQEYDLWKEGKITAKTAMAHLGLKPNTFYRRVKEYEDSLGDK